MLEKLTVKQMRNHWAARRARSGFGTLFLAAALGMASWGGYELADEAKTGDDNIEITIINNRVIKTVNYEKKHNLASIFFMSTSVALGALGGISLAFAGGRGTSSVKHITGKKDREYPRHQISDPENLNS